MNLFTSQYKSLYGHTLSFWVNNWVWNDWIIDTCTYLWLKKLSVEEIISSFFLKWFYPFTFLLFCTEREVCETSVPAHHVDTFMVSLLLVILILLKWFHIVILICISLMICWVLTLTFYSLSSVWITQVLILKPNLLVDPTFGIESVQSWSNSWLKTFSSMLSYRNFTVYVSLVWCNIQTKGPFL